MISISGEKVSENKTVQNFYVFELLFCSTVWNFQKNSKAFSFLYGANSAQDSSEDMQRLD